jgi:hypothetical protein
MKPGKTYWEIGSVGGREKQREVALVEKENSMG